jgi:ribonucleoside-diphosphate reductase alpha chain
MEFIECKHKEEQKAHCLIEKGGYEANFNGEAYSSILFQNANLSVRVTDEFMYAVEQDREWVTHWVTDPGRDGPRYSARQVLQRMAECAWHCGDPGVQYDTTINRWHTCPNSGRINASNPCSEYMFLDDTACNLASINLMKFRQEDGSFDHQRFQTACRVYLIAQEILVDHASYPTDRIAANSHRFRPLGLGYSNLGSLIMTSGLAYDSDAARGLCGSITALLHGAANLTSAELADAVGPFDAYAENRDAFLHVMQMHRQAVEQINDSGPPELKSAARRVWDEVLRRGRERGFRNAQATVLAPTGTISFMMDCDTTGIEPDIALVKYKQLAGGGMLKIINRTVPLALKTLGYRPEQIERICQYIDEHDTIEGAADLSDEDLAVFDCAFKPASGTRSIPWQAHVSMMAAAQPFLSGAISKTVNMPSDVTPQDIAEAYRWGWQLGLKALAIYRDGSKQSQPLSTSTEGEKAAGKEGRRPRRERLPDTRQSVTHKFNVNGHEGYITVGLYDDGRPGELFITMAKEGSTIGGLMDSFGTAVSMSLQYGVPLEVLVNKFSHTRFEPMGYTTNPDIRIAKSLVDYIFRWLGLSFIPGYREAALGLPASGGKSESTVAAIAAPLSTTTKGKLGSGKSTSNGHATNGHAGDARSNADQLDRAGVRMKDDQDCEAQDRHDQFARFQSDAPSCDNCGAITVRNGNCYLCHNCGNSMGCS